MENSFKKSAMTYNDFENKLDKLLELHKDYTDCCLDEFNGTCSKETYEQTSRIYYDAYYEFLRMIQDLYECADETRQRARGWKI
jgi:hypothetical protein